MKCRHWLSLRTALALLLAAVGIGRAMAEEQVTATAEQHPGGFVEIVDFMRFAPATVVIRAGQSVTWVNHDGSNHKIQFADSVSARLRHDVSYSKRFDQEGRYDYTCGIHGKKMSGTVIVQSPLR